MHLNSLEQSPECKKNDTEKSIFFYYCYYYLMILSPYSPICRIIPIYLEAKKKNVTCKEG